MQIRNPSFKTRNSNAWDYPAKKFIQPVLFRSWFFVLLNDTTENPAAQKPMDPDATTKQAIFEAARQLPSEKERRAYLDRACREDPELRREIEALLELQGPANEFFQDTNSDPPGQENSSRPNCNPSQETS